MAEFELILPCYNEEKSIESLICRARDAAQELGVPHSEFQLILVENGSSDTSNDVMDRLASTELGQWFRKVGVDINQGYGFGILSGLRATRAPFVGWSHADEQCDPKDALIAYKQLKASGDTQVLIKGVRSGRRPMEILVSRVFEMVAFFLLGFKCYEINAQPKVFSRELLSHLQNPPKTFAFDLYVLYRAQKAGYRFQSIPVQFHSRAHGLSRWAYNPLSRYKTILGMIRYIWQLSRVEGRV